MNIRLTKDVLLMKLDIVTKLLLLALVVALTANLFKSQPAQAQGGGGAPTNGSIVVVDSVHKVVFLSNGNDVKGFKYDPDGATAKRPSKQIFQQSLW